MKVRNWFFSAYKMTLSYHQIKDTAYSKNNFFHFLFNFWTFFARSSPWEWDFSANYLKYVEQFFNLINYIYSLPQEERDKLQPIENLKIFTYKKVLSKDQTIAQEIQNLLSIIWIKEVILLDKKDKKFIFENEEDRNHWVYEAINREATLCATHDSDFRNADAPIVHKIWEKVIFPWISFHEIQQKNVISASPGIAVHKYLSSKFKNLDKDDATLIIWFDVN